MAKKRRVGILVVDKFLQFFAGAEEGKALGVHFNNSSGLGIATGVAFVILDFEAAETANFNTVASDESVLDGIKKSADDFGRIINVQLFLIGEGLDEFTFVHGVISVFGRFKHSPK